MAAAVCCPLISNSLQPEQGGLSHQQSHEPINFLYGHLHNSIRTELDNLSTWALSLEADNEQDLLHRLLHLKERYHFLEQVYKYHSSVEDEVVYPALDTKVKNVTSAYTVEHQDEEYLFEHLAGLLTSALTQNGAERTGTIRQLICKTEEISITLRKHLAKEEAQLLPLLLQHFSHAEQAELVAQFLYCIPLDTVERVLSWLKPMVPMAELLELMQHLRDVIPDRLLLQLLVTWLNPVAGSTAAAAGGSLAAVAGSSSSATAVAQVSCDATASGSQLVICPFASGAIKQSMGLPGAAVGGCRSSDASSNGSGAFCAAHAGVVHGQVAATVAASAAAVQAWPPLRGIVLFHHSIQGALEVFASEAAALQQQSGVTASQLAGLVERHRFLRSVCMFHSLSEEEVMFPEVLRISGLGLGPNLGSVITACGTCQQEHTSEIVLFEELGRLLADVRAFVRRGRTRDVSGMLGKLVDTAQKVCSAIGTHMQREEQEVLPLLAASLAPEQQRAMVWHTLRAMPLRLLERVLPWLLSKLSQEDAEGIMTNLRLGASQADQQLVELLLRWAQRGRWPLPHARLPGSGSISDPAPVPASPQPVIADDHQQGRQEAAAAAPAGPQDESVAAEPAGQEQHQNQGPLHVVPAAVIEALCRSCGKVTSLTGPTSTVPDEHSHDSAVHDLATNQQQQQLWGSHDPCFFSNNTCELRLIRQASDSSGSPRKRQRLGDISGPAFDNSSSPDVTPTAAAAAAAAAAGQVAGAASAAAALAGAVTIQGLSSHNQQQQPRQDGRLTQCAEGNAVSSRVADPAVAAPVAATVAGSTQPPTAAATAASSRPPGCNPIDHIFQFHKALRRELKQLEADAAALEHAVLGSCELMEQQQRQSNAQQQQQPKTQQQQQQQPNAQQQQPNAQQQQPNAQQRQQSLAEAAHADHMASPASATELLKQVCRALQQLDGRFQFLWGIYRAHSKAEDEIVFPALESKEALHNVSHAYTLDHEQEEQLFHDLAAVIGNLKHSNSALEARDLALQLRRMCAAVRASLETHVRAEEAELWPLFSEHFSIREQQHLVGVIIGRTGAEVLQALLPWVTGSFSEEEKEAMMGSLREATKNTMFDQWLGAVQSGSSAGGSSSVAAGQAGAQTAGGAAADPATAVSIAPDLQQQQGAELAEIVEYLVGIPSPATPGHTAQQQQHPEQQQQQTEVSGTVAESTNYVPGWEDIFNINQKQLEAAVRRVSNDPNLEPQRKAYLIQNIMVSRYIVAQQRRMGQQQHLQQQHSGQLQQQGSASGAMLPPAVPAQQQQQLGSQSCCHHSSRSLHDHHHHHGPQQQQQQQFAAASSASHSAVPLSVAMAAAAGTVGVAAKTFADASSGVLGCKHYRRSAQLVAPCCGKVFTCRLCHDDACDHRLDRYAVKEMVCMLCNTRQPVAATCSSCCSSMSSYYCGICHLFDDEPGRDIYHCPFCNVCRRGKGLGVDFFHCMQCNACMSLSLFNSHTCRERAMEGNCPVCHEYLFDSATPIKELPCGHFLHSSCFAEYARYSYTCPICCKSIGDMSVYFQMLDSLLTSERSKLPVEYAGRQQQVLCQDCGKVGMAPYHFVYHACPRCHSYNTRVL